MDWRKIPFPERKALLEYIRNAGAEVSASKGCFRLFFDGADAERIKEAVLDSRLDDIFDKGEVLRHSSQSIYAVLSGKGISPVLCCERFYEEYHRWRKAHDHAREDHRRIMDGVMNKLKSNFQG